MKISGVALVGAAAVVAAQPHNHAHLHADKHLRSPVEKRGADVTEVVNGPTVTVFELNGTGIPSADVEAGLKAGIYVLVSESASPTTTSSATSSQTTTASSTVEAGQFFQKSTSSTVSVAPTTTSAAPTTTSTSVTVAAASASASSSSSTSTGTGVTSEFPSGKISCDTFPSSYGAVYVDWLNLNGWIGIQNVPSYTPGDSSISYISTAISGGCTKNSYCSYACPAGYQKTQWPSAQGSTGQSIGGLYCNSNGFLEISNTAHKTLCMAGTGSIKVQNKLSKNVAICRTDYPGTESETVPLNTLGGNTYDLTCPDANNYYTWGGAFTSAQYYVNPSGVSEADGCQWGTGTVGVAGKNIGNWAPVNIGVGKGPAGTTYISMFQNKPTNPDGVLDFDITITGDISGDCKYKGGKFYNNGVYDPSGCTVLVTGIATYVLS